MKGERRPVRRFIDGGMAAGIGDPICPASLRPTARPDRPGDPGRSRRSDRRARRTRRASPGPCRPRCLRTGSADRGGRQRQVHPPATFVVFARTRIPPGAPEQQSRWSPRLIALMDGSHVRPDGAGRLAGGSEWAPPRSPTMVPSCRAGQARIPNASGTSARPGPGVADGGAFAFPSWASGRLRHCCGWLLGSRREPPLAQRTGRRQTSERGDPAGSARMRCGRATRRLSQGEGDRAAYPRERRASRPEMAFRATGSAPPSRTAGQAWCRT